MATIDPFEAGIADYIADVRQLERVFNEHAAEIGLAVRIEIDRLIASVEDGTVLDRVSSYFTRDDDSGVLHAEQLKTAIDCVARLLDQPGHNGVVLGAMQSGKTTTSLALQFAGPILYALTGRRLYPIYLTTSHTSQADQTQIELTNFLNYYGLIRISATAPNPEIQLEAGFVRSPTIGYYRTYVLRRAFLDTYAGPQLEEFVQRRVRGQRIQQLADLCGRVNDQGFEPLLMIDEPQFGASDGLVVNEDGLVERRSCVLLQMFEAIDQAVGGRARYTFIGLSATPYDLHEVESVWVARQYLSSAYRGFNYFGRYEISEGVEIEPPATLGFTALGQRFNLPQLGQVSMAAYKGTPRRFLQFAQRVGFSGNHDEYREMVESVVRSAIFQMVAEHSGEPIGICLRPFNSNNHARDFIDALDLPAGGIEVIHYSGSEFAGMSVKRVIRARRHPDRPFIIVVTNRARMGDAFPVSVKWFMDFSARASDLNALLQGLLGRACGYGKDSTVVLSDDNESLVADYRRTRGGYFYRTSRHSVVAGGFRRGAPTNLIRVRADMNDRVVQRFFQRLESEVVEPVIIQNRSTLQPQRMREGGFRTGAILRIAREEGLFEYLENPDVAAALFPNLPEFRIVRPGEEVPHSRDPSRLLSYTLDENGDCRFTFRWSDGQGSHTGVASRGYGNRDATDGAPSNNLEPQIHMEKYDPETGDVIFDKGQPDKVLGNWRAYMLTLPLSEPVRELRQGASTLPNDRSVHVPLLSEEEKAAIGL